MACNFCAKPYSLLLKEKGCPGCGFSYCSKCLNNKIFIPKLNAQAKVCLKCKNATESGGDKGIPPPDAYFKKLEKMAGTSCSSQNQTSVEKVYDKDDEIKNRLLKLKEKDKHTNVGKDEQIRERLNNLKGKIQTGTDEEIQNRLANLRGYNINATQNKPLIPSKNLRTEQEQADDLLKQYLDQTKMEDTYKDQFDQQVDKMTARLQNLKGERIEPNTSEIRSESEDEEDTIRKIVQKIKAEAQLDTEVDTAEDNTELPFCEICNEDATRRCCGCRYLFCKRCFQEHRDDDYECNSYEDYKPKNHTQI